MIHYLKGKIEFKDKRLAVIEVGGVGYKVFCSLPVLERLPEIGQETKIYTRLFPKEDKIELYGFLNKKELELFETLEGISGIGPRTALDLSIFGSLENLKQEIEKGGFDQRIKGIGRKKMQKILLELTGKIKELKIPERGEPADGTLDALVFLGFPRQRAKEALARVPGELSQEERVKKALRILGQG